MELYGRGGQQRLTTSGVKNMMTNHQPQSPTSAGVLSRRRPLLKLFIGIATVQLHDLTPVVKSVRPVLFQPPSDEAETFTDAALRDEDHRLWSSFPDVNIVLGEQEQDHLFSHQRRRGGTSATVVDEDDPIPDFQLGGAFSSSTATDRTELHQEHIHSQQPEPQQAHLNPDFNEEAPPLLHDDNRLTIEAYSAEQLQKLPAGGSTTATGVQQQDLVSTPLKTWTLPRWLVEENSALGVFQAQASDRWLSLGGAQDHAEAYGKSPDNCRTFHREVDEALRDSSRSGNLVPGWKTSSADRDKLHNKGILGFDFFEQDQQMMMSQDSLSDTASTRAATSIAPTTPEPLKPAASARVGAAGSAADDVDVVMQHYTTPPEASKANSTLRLEEETDEQVLALDLLFNYAARGRRVPAGRLLSTLSKTPAWTAIVPRTTAGRGTAEDASSITATRSPSSTNLLALDDNLVTETLNFRCIESLEKVRLAALELIEGKIKQERVQDKDLKVLRRMVLEKSFALKAIQTPTVLVAANGAKQIGYQGGKTGAQKLFSTSRTARGGIINRLEQATGSLAVFLAEEMLYHEKAQRTTLHPAQYDQLRSRADLGPWAFFRQVPKYLVLNKFRTPVSGYVGRRGASEREPEPRQSTSTPQHQLLPTISFGAQLLLAVADGLARNKNEGVYLDGTEAEEYVSVLCGNKIKAAGGTSVQGGGGPPWDTINDGRGLQQGGSSFSAGGTGGGATTTRTSSRTSISNAGSLSFSAGGPLGSTRASGSSAVDNHIFEDPVTSAVDKEDIQLFRDIFSPDMPEMVDEDEYPAHTHTSVISAPQPGSKKRNRQPTAYERARTTRLLRRSSTVFSSGSTTSSSPSSTTLAGASMSNGSASAPVTPCCSPSLKPMRKTNSLSAVAEVDVGELELIQQLEEDAGSPSFVSGYNEQQQQLQIQIQKNPLQQQELLYAETDFHHDTGREIEIFFEHLLSRHPTMFLVFHNTKREKFVPHEVKLDKYFKFSYQHGSVRQFTSSDFAQEQMPFLRLHRKLREDREFTLKFLARVLENIGNADSFVEVEMNRNKILTKQAEPIRGRPRTSPAERTYVLTREEVASPPPFPLATVFSKLNRQEKEKAELIAENFLLKHDEAEAAHQVDLAPLQLGKTKTTTTTTTRRNIKLAITIPGDEISYSARFQAGNAFYSRRVENSNRPHHLRLYRFAHLAPKRSDVVLTLFRYSYEQMFLMRQEADEVDTVQTAHELFQTCAVEFVRIFPSSLAYQDWWVDKEVVPLEKQRLELVLTAIRAMRGVWNT
ncbi:unnamed protein product [Amoebophrya sp. A120]|nr:unnamed protein product [Amoebophrya sp. A120]|eukprot:GSA120T00006822001.1